MIEKIKKEIGSKRDLPGLTLFISNRARMYGSLVGIPFLVLERFFAIMDIDLGISEYLKSLPPWMTFVGIGLGITLGGMYMYVDLKFIYPAERRTSTKRDPFIQDIWRGINELRSERQNIRSNSKLQRRLVPESFAWMLGKEEPKDRGRG